MFGVPIWRDAPVPLGRVVNHRVVSAALAMIAGLNAISIAISKGRDLGILQVVLPAALCAVASLFALWQLWLIVIAARRTIREGGDRRFAGLAIAGAAFAAAVVAGILHEKAVPQLEEMWDILQGDERLGDLDIVVVDEGRTLILDGALGIDAAKEVRAALERNAGLRTVVVAGPGGRVGPAYQIARLIRARGLETRVERQCYYACTVVFLGGVRRAIGPRGELGFHRLSFPGMDDSELADANRSLRDFMTFVAQVAAPFVRRVMETPSESIWIPTPRELLDAGVIHQADERRK
jgi:hypothetical protein